MSRVIKYIQLTIGLPLILSINKSGNTKWYVDSDFAVHKDIMRNTGGFVNMVTGGDYLQSIKHDLNTNISTDAKLV